MDPKSPTMTRRRLLAGAVGAAGVTVLAACGETQVEEKAVPTAAPAQQAVAVEKVVTADTPAAARVQTAAPAEKVVTVEPAALRAELEEIRFATDHAPGRAGRIHRHLQVIARDIDAEKHGVGHSGTLPVALASRPAS